MRAVNDAIYRRIAHQRMDFVRDYGIVAVNEAVADQVEFIGDVEEIGSSDVSCWILNIEDTLKRRKLALSNHNGS